MEPGAACTMFYSYQRDDTEVHSTTNTTVAYTTTTKVSVTTRRERPFPAFPDRPERRAGFPTGPGEWRLSSPQVGALKFVSTQWRATCNRNKTGNDFVRAKFVDFDVLSFQGTGCKKVEEINIRGHYGNSTPAWTPGGATTCMTRWTQSAATVRYPQPRILITLDS